MKQKSGPGKAPAEQVLKDIRRQTRRQYSAEEKIRIVLEGLRGEENISELCRREGIAAAMYYGWSKEFREAGKRRLAGDTAIRASHAASPKTSVYLISRKRTLLWQECSPKTIYRAHEAPAEHLAHLAGPSCSIRGDTPSFRPGNIQRRRLQRVVQSKLLRLPLRT